MEVVWVLLVAAIIWFLVDLIRVQDIWARLPQHDQDKLIAGRPLTNETREFLQRRFYFPTSSRRFLLVIVLLIAIGAVFKLMGFHGA